MQLCNFPSQGSRRKRKCGTRRRGWPPTTFTSRAAPRPASAPPRPTLTSLHSSPRVPRDRRARVRAASHRVPIKAILLRRDRGSSLLSSPRVPARTAKRPPSKSLPRARASRTTDPPPPPPPPSRTRRAEHLGVRGPCLRRLISPTRDVAFGGAADGADPAPPVVFHAPGGRRRRRAGALHRPQARQRHPPRPMVQQGR